MNNQQGPTRAQGTQLNNVMWQPGWEGSLGKIFTSFTCCCVFLKNPSMEKGLDDSMNQREEKQR